MNQNSVFNTDSTGAVTTQEGVVGRLRSKVQFIYTQISKCNYIQVKVGVSGEHRHGEGNTSGLFTAILLQTLRFSSFTLAYSHNSSDPQVDRQSLTQGEESRLTYGTKETQKNAGD